MESFKSGFCRMVKLIVSLFFIFFINIARAEFLLGVSTNSWQELVPVIIQNVQSDALTSFTGLGVSTGYQYKYTDRMYIIASVSFLSGTVDVHKQSNAIAPRRNFTSYWISNKLIWRSTKSFTYGPNLVINYRKLDELQPVLSYGVFIDLNYEIFQEIRLTQSLGTISDSKQIAYSISLNRVF